MSESDYHIPVMLDQCVDYLNIKSDGIYLDVTYGGGGHSKSIIEKLDSKGHLFGFDQDSRALQNAIVDDRFTMIHGNFRFVKHFMNYYGVTHVDGILADLGVSSFHFDEPSRGFSYRFDAGLDMRMNKMSRLTAAEILRTYQAEALQDIFSQYGEIRNARTLSEEICSVRRHTPLRSTGDLVSIIDRIYRGSRKKYMAQVFQALRIEVNDEIGVLERFLKDSLEVLAPGGRMVVLAYHSIEDKVVKKYLKSTSGGGAEERNTFGRVIEKYRIITRRPIVPSSEEIKSNSRAASAKLRVIEKIN